MEIPKALRSPTFSFLGGAAGSGKTWLIRRWANEDSGLILSASTGIASINLGGSTTINSLLGYFNTHSLKDKYTTGMLTGALGRLWKTGVKRVVIDEASMISGEVLTYLVRGIDEVNGRGYVLDARWEDEDTPPALGLTLVGDPCQLGPVPDKEENPAPGKRAKNLPTGYFFESPEWAKFETTILTTVHRQADPAFIEALRAARRGDASSALAYFRPLLHDRLDDHFEGSTIFAKNDSVERHNQLRLDALPGREISFESARWGDQRSEWGRPDRPPVTWGIPKELKLKEGALVMILANAYDDLGNLTYVNGDLGIVTGVEDSCAVVELQRTGRSVQVAYVTRQVKVTADAVRRKQLREEGKQDRIDGKWEITGAITYMPLKLAYGSTTHKSQGLTLDRVQVDLRDPFFKLPSMLYVALSRCRSAAGLRIVGSPAVFQDRVRVDPRLAAWF